MSVNKNSAYVSNMARPVMRAVTNGHLQTHFLQRLHWMMSWQVRLRKKNSQPIMSVAFESGNERFVKDGYYRISAEENLRKRTIDILTVNLLLPYIH